MTDDERRASKRRREQIHELLVEEMTAHGDLEPGDVVTHWIALVGTHAYSIEDDDGDDRDDGNVAAVGSVPMPALHNQLGLLDRRRIDIQAVMVRAWMGEDDDD